MGGHRAGMHYRTKKAGGPGPRTTAHKARDAQYRAALGIEDAGPLPREIGSVQHQRPDPGSLSELD